ncbi:MAG: YggU family protein [Gammaproteobacteria bacterium]|nr:YggU family protein [Gammaproteobacteria bacterium]
MAKLSAALAPLDHLHWYRWQGEDLILNLRLQPRASCDQFLDIYNESGAPSRLRLRLTAPPLEGRANRQLIGFLADAFGVTKSSVTILSGETGRNKQVKIAVVREIPDTLAITLPRHGGQLKSYPALAD